MRSAASTSPARSASKARAYGLMGTTTASKRGRSRRRTSVRRRAQAGDADARPRATRESAAASRRRRDRSRGRSTCRAAGAGSPRRWSASARSRRRRRRVARGGARVERLGVGALGVEGRGLRVDLAGEQRPEHEEVVAVGGEGEADGARHRRGPRSRGHSALSSDAMRFGAMRDSLAPRLRALRGERAHLLERAPGWGGEADRRDRACGPGRPPLPRRAVEDRVHRTQLRRAREGAGHEVPAEPLLFLKPPSALLGPGGVGAPAAREHARRARGGARRRHRRAREERRAARTRCRTSSVTRARATSRRATSRRRTCSSRAPRASNVLPHRPVDRDGARPGDVAVGAASTGRRARTGWTENMIFDMPDADRLREPDDDARAGQRNPRRGRPKGSGRWWHGDELEVEVTGIGGWGSASGREAAARDRARRSS